MKKRSFDEMIAYFNRRVSEMDIDHDYKMELLGMVTAIGYKHEQTAQQWILCSEQKPSKGEAVLLCFEDLDMAVGWFDGSDFACWDDRVDDGYGDAIAWMPLPEPYGGEQDDASHPFADDVMMRGEQDE